MALQKPLVFDSVRGVPRALDPGDALHLPGDLRLGGQVGFYGITPGPQPQVAGSWGQTLDQLVNALALLGLISDKRPTNWQSGINSLSSASAVGPYEPGRLIIGSITGWMQLDQPAAVPGVIQAVTAHAGAVETNPVSGLPTRQLAYSPLLSYGATPPATAALTGALWFDTGASALKVWDGSGWHDVQPALLGALAGVLAGAAPGALLSADGTGGVELLTPGAGREGRVMVIDRSERGQFIELVVVGPAAPWANGQSAYGPAPNGNRPAGVHQAIWGNTSLGSETIGFWDEAAHQWKTVAVNNPVLDGLAGLRGALADGDLLTVSHNAVARLPIGGDGASLMVDGATAVWHQRFSSGASAPSASVDGDLWLDAASDVAHVRQGSRWVAVGQTIRHSKLNATGGALLIGTPLVDQGASWAVAGPSAASGSAIAIALAASAAGAATPAAVGGVVSLSAAQWSAVIDSAEAHAAGSGLSPGRDYYVSSITAGKLTSKPAAGRGIPVGTALSSTHLLLRCGPMAESAIKARVQVSAAAPAGAVGELWWSDALSQLAVFTDDGTTQKWTPVLAPSAPAAPGGPTTPGPAAVGISDLEVIDWMADPATAAVQIHYSDGSSSSLRLKGAGGTVVTMSDNRTLVIDAGGSSIPSNAAGLPPGARDGQMLVWRGGVPVWETVATGGGAAMTGVLRSGNGVSSDAATGVITGIDEGAF
jgi:hypothetical protein